MAGLIEENWMDDDRNRVLIEQEERREEISENMREQGIRSYEEYVAQCEEAAALDVPVLYCPCCGHLGLDLEELESSDEDVRCFDAYCSNCDRSCDIEL